MALRELLRPVAENPPRRPHGTSFEELVARRIDYQGDDACWMWRGNPSQERGKIYTGGRERYAYQVVYELLVGPIPDGLELDHLCRNPACVNPAHLEPVSHQENMARGAFGARTHCKWGHEFTPENTYKYGRTRMCKTCMYLRNRAYREARRGEN